MWKQGTLEMSWVGASAKGATINLKAGNPVD